MKNLFLFLATISIFVSCGKGDREEITTPENEPTKIEEVVLSYKDSHTLNIASTDSLEYYTVLTDKSIASFSILDGNGEYVIDTLTSSLCDGTISSNGNVSVQLLANDAWLVIKDAKGRRKGVNFISSAEILNSEGIMAKYISIVDKNSTFTFKDFGFKHGYKLKHIAGRAISGQYIGDNTIDFAFQQSGVSHYRVYDDLGVYINVIAASSDYSTFHEFQGNNISNEKMEINIGESKYIILDSKYNWQLVSIESDERMHIEPNGSKIFMGIYVTCDRLANEGDRAILTLKRNNREYVTINIIAK